MALATSASCTPFKDDGVPDAATAVDAGSRCDTHAPFGTPTLVGGLDEDTLHATSVQGLRLSPDALTAYFDAEGRADSVGSNDLYTAHRDSPTGTFGGVAPILGSGLNTLDDDFYPTVSGNGLTLFYAWMAPPFNPTYFYVASRDTTFVPFTGPRLLPSLQIGGTASVTTQTTPFLRSDGKVLYFAFSTDENYLAATDIYWASWNGSELGGAVSAGDNVNSEFSEVSPVVTDDDLTLYFASDRTDQGAQGAYDVWVATRGSATDAFSTPTIVTEVNTTASDLPTFATEDGCKLYLTSERDGIAALWVATKPGM